MQRLNFILKGLFNFFSSICACCVLSDMIYPRISSPFTNWLIPAQYSAVIGGLFALVLVVINFIELLFRDEDHANDH